MAKLYASLGKHTNHSFTLQDLHVQQLLLAIKKNIEEIQKDMEDVKMNMENIQHDMQDMKAKGIAVSHGDDEYTSKNRFDDFRKFGFKAKSLNEVSVRVANLKKCTGVLISDYINFIYCLLIISLNIVLFCSAV